VANTTGFKARVEYEVTDGTQKTYTFPFSYLRKKFVMVSILHSDASETALEYGVDYTVNDLSVSLTTPAQVGEHIIIYRQTSTDKIVTWNDGSILLARDMNTEDAQMLHLQEEQQDYIMAHAISTKVTSDKEVLWDALNHRVSNVSDPKDPQDAVTKNYMETVQGGFVAANKVLVQEATKQASAAKDSQDAAKVSETNAHTSETNSEISHQNAKKWAESTDSPDNQTDTDSTTGKTQSSRSWALYSKVKAQEAATSATNAKTSETNAKSSETNAKTSETKALTSEQKAKTSETNAKASETHAKTSETNAKTAENNAGIYSGSAYSSYIKSRDWAESTGSPDGEDDSLSATGKTRSARGWAMQAKEYAGSLNLSFILDTLLPVGTVYMTENANFDPNSSWGVGMWVKTAIDRVLQGTNDKSKVGTTIEAGLPNITGGIYGLIANDEHALQGALHIRDNGNVGTLVHNVQDTGRVTLDIDASRSSSIYGNSDTVQPPVELVFIWKRIA
jgi:hypothetical protein